MNNKILKHYNLQGDDIVKKKSHILPDILAKDLIHSILVNTTAKDISNSLGISVSTFSNLAKKLFPNKVGKGYWRDHITKELGRKTCSTCNKTLDNSDFSIGSLTCRPCVSIRNSEYLEDNHASILRGKAKYREANKAKLNEIARDRYSETTKTVAQIAAKAEYDRARGKDPIVRKTRNAYSAKRRASLLSATPSWADLEAIVEIYRTCPEGYHVDHIIPLQGDLVCGLHTETNLQHLLAEDNLKKGNKFHV